MQNFVGETFVDMTAGEGNYPVLVALVGAASEEDALSTLIRQTTKEFPPEVVDETRVADVSQNFTRICDAGLLGKDWGMGAVRVPPVYLCVDESAESRERAIAFARSVLTE